MQKEVADLKDRANFIVISQDTPEKNKALMKKTGLIFPIYSDADLEAAEKFGLVFKINQKTKEIYLKYNIDLEALYGRDVPKMPTPAVFVLDKAGKITFSYVNPDYSKRLSPNILRAVLENQD